VTAARLRMAGIGKRFGATRALAGVDLEVRAGEVHGLIGENGAGKSTLMKVLSGALRPDTGAMELDEAPYAPRSPADGRARGISMIYQELSLAPHLTALENVVLGAEPRRGLLLDRAEARRRAARALEAVGRPDLPLDVPVSRLTVAEQQLVEIARSLALGCRVFVFDEPTSSLTSADAEHLFAFVTRLRDEGHAVVIISHALEEIEAHCDRYTVLRDGVVAARGDRETFDAERVVAEMVGREVSDLYPRSDREAGEVLLSVEALAGQPLPHAASLELRRGEVLGIAGLVGAGRTELLRALFGLDPVASGAVTIGAVPGPLEPRRAWRAGVGFVSEDRKREGLALSRSVAENLCLPRLDRLGSRGLVAPRALEREAARWIEHLGVRCESPRQEIGRLSGGNQQKVALARLLSADVDLLFLDEPTRGVDVGAKAEIYRWIDALARGDPEEGRAPRAVLMVSSYLPELLGVCDRIAVMTRGRLGPARPVGERTEHEILMEATGAA